MIQFETEFKIGDRVYYKLPESPIGIIVDIHYYHATRTAYYTVQWNPQDNPSSCRDYELTVDKVIV